MKSPNYLKIFALIALLINSAGLALGQESSSRREHILTIAMTLTGQGPEAYKESNTGYTLSTKIITEKISNKNFLQSFIDEGIINEITGWSIVSLSEEGDIKGFYLKKKGEDSINVSDFFDFKYESANVPYTLKETYSETNTSISISMEYSGRCLGNLNFLVSGDVAELNLYGIFSFTGYERVTGTVGQDDPVTESVLTSFSLEKGTGELYLEEMGFVGVIDGYYKAGKGIPTLLGTEFLR